MSDVRVMLAKRFHTMEPGFPTAEAVAVRGDRILAVGSLDEVKASLVDVPYDLDDTLKDLVVLPGLIDQHLHPMLGAATLSMNVISTEDWSLPDGLHPGAFTPEQYIGALVAADKALTDAGSEEWLQTWGYHQLWHGPMSRQVLDEISTTRPIMVWHRSAHELFLNTAACDVAGVTEAWLAAQSGHATSQVDIAAGHCWESGFFDLVLTRVAPQLAARDRLERGLKLLVTYLHQQGVTAVNEPGVIWAVEPWDLYEQILGADDTPFLSTFLVDGRSQASANIDPSDVVADARTMIARAPTGKVRLFDGAVKLMADGAIISQLMQMQEPYLDDAGNPDPHHHGEWVMEPAVLEKYFRPYWEAGWQISVHVTGDLGLKVLLDIIERCMIAHPRNDHRTTIVHFSNSTEEQVDRIARLGCIVSANPFYPVAFADRFGQHGVGPERADAMVRSASVLAHGTPLSFHSDLPMAPAEPLFLAWCGATRRTESGRVAAPDQLISVHEALKAVTIGAAHSWRMEDELGSIAPGKVANFTVIGGDPYEHDADYLKDVPVMGTVFEGRWFPVPEELRKTGDGQARKAAVLPSVAAPTVGGSSGQHTDHDAGCGCEASGALAKAMGDAWRVVG